MKKVLFISPPDSMWTYNLITNVRPADGNVYIYTTEDTDVTKRLEQQGYKLVKGTSDNRAVYRIPVAGAVLLCAKYRMAAKRIFRKYGNFDVIHISWIVLHEMTAMGIMRRHAKRIICTFWGSDLLRVSAKNLKRYRPGLEKADAVTVSTEYMKQHFCDVFGNRLGKKIRLARFGLESFKYITLSEEDAGRGKEYFHIPSDRICVTIGYNGSIQQQHIDVIRTLAGIEEPVRSRLFLVLPATYGLEEGYRQRLVEELEKAGFKYLLVERNLKDDEIGKLRMAADIFIHAQTTDAFSASVQEYLYAGKVIFNPAWIRYRELEKKDVFFYEYSDFPELKEKLLQYLNGTGDLTDLADRLAGNREKIRQLSSWDCVAQSWRAIYSL